MNAVEITSRDNQLSFQLVQDKEVIYEDGWIRQECDKKEIQPFQFHTVDSEETCVLYESKFKHSIRQLRDYGEYIMWSIHTPNIILDMKLFYI